MSSVHSNRSGIAVKLSWQLGITRINCIKNISEKTIVGSGQSRLLTGTGITLEGICSYTMGNRVDRFENWEWGKKIRND